MFEKLHFPNTHIKLFEFHECFDLEKRYDQLFHPSLSRIEEEMINIVRISYYLIGETMSNVEITKMSSRGQIVIPKDIREEIGMREGDYLAIFSSGDTICLKRLEMIALKKRFEKTANRLEKIAIEKGITSDDIDEAVKNARK